MALSRKGGDLSTDLIFPAGATHDMLNEPLGPYRLTLEEFHALPVGPLQLERREAIRDLAAAMFTADLTGTGLERITQGHPLADPVLHFTPGICARELHMAAGLRVVGLRHRQEHLNIISKGRATVMTERGKQEIEAPCSFMSPAGTQRFVWVHEDMIWTTIHRCDETDKDKALAFIFMDEDEVIAERILEMSA